MFFSVAILMMLAVRGDTTEDKMNYHITLRNQQVAIPLLSLMGGSTEHWTVPINIDSLPL